MRNTVIIKSNAYGLILMLDPDISFEQLLTDTAEKFKEAKKFFHNAKMALTFQGRELSSGEEKELVRVISENAGMHIVCLVDENKEHASVYEEALVRTIAHEKEGKAVWHQGSVTSGQTLESDTNLIIFGDVNPGATVTAAGSVIIFGCCMGSVTAGFGGDRDTFVAATVLKPSYLHIGDKAARSAITKKEDTGEYPPDPKVAFIRDDHLVMDTMKGYLTCSDNID